MNLLAYQPKMVVLLETQEENTLVMASSRRSAGGNTLQLQRCMLLALAQLALQPGRVPALPL